MGREWHWGRSMRRAERVSAGCMSGVLQLFDFHQFQCLSEQQQEEQEEKTVTKKDLFLLDSMIVKGAEAPRNSLELENEPVAMEEDDMPIGIRILPRPGEAAVENSNSQGSRTPNLVARLMGLDLLPEDALASPSNRRPSPSPAKSRRLPLKVISFRESSGYESGTRSLPDTPRISSARRSDVDPRLSLQLNKENMDVVELNYLSPCSRKMKSRDGRNYQYEENRSPSRYAREIVRQMKESVGRKVGIEITNSHTNNSVSRSKNNLESDGGYGNFKKTKRIPAKGKEVTTPSCSPRIRFLEPRTRSVVTEEYVSNSPKATSKPRILSTPIPPPPPKPVPCKDSSTVRFQQTPPLPKPAGKCKKASNERFTGRLRKPPVSEESFVVPKASLVKKKSKDTCGTRIQTPSPPSQILHQHQQQQLEAEEQRRQQQEQDGVSTERTPPLPSSSRPTLYEPLHQPLAHRDDNCTTTTTNTDDGSEFRYVKGILDRTGIQSRDPLPIIPWFSPSHPLDPTLFHLLELHFDHILHRSHRKLLFHLVDELLVQILKPYLKFKPWFSGPHMTRQPITGYQLLNCLWAQIQRFPSANCQTLKDIDALLACDLRDGDMRSRSCDECEGVVLHIEREILDDLVRETVTMSQTQATEAREGK